MASSLGSILVVGGCGFLGHHIISELLEQDASASISVLDLRTDANRHPAVTYYSGDISNKSQVEAVFAKVKPKTVFHTVSPHPLQVNHKLLDKVNVVGTRNLVACAQQAGTVAFVYTSSTSVVHDHHSPLCDATEAAYPVIFHPQQPEHYSHTKAVAETLVLDANRVGGLLTASIRPTTIHGEGDLLVTGNLCRTACGGRAWLQFGDGTNLMDTTYVGNVAHAEVLAAHALVAASSSSSPLPEARRVEGEAFFVRNDERYPFWEINRMAARMAGYPVEEKDVWAVPLWLAMAGAFLAQWLVWGLTLGRKEPLLTTRVVRLVTIERTFSIDKIRGRLGYRPRVSTEEGLQRAVRWYMREVYAKKDKRQ
ncbi:C-3 sterol dehydrogenase/C-4 decarboxylase family protein [Coniochaeta ligniaria NRRL 30616]|uniref:C-3 sterol dehydrogenase/C-4 decarboxylase family protein n=1 Tax=Coniochaeta ligniaria NRRL 30616 TaxID=1408157 RepID=A0A1J7JIH2_9PEZI|nr:C-3 sterol dehydrogenase/C-4 decarboxylase family protein [Coniochaeta ligniaria NRRL 30616]